MGPDKIFEDNMPKIKFYFSFFIINILFHINLFAMKTADPKKHRPESIFEFITAFDL